MKYQDGRFVVLTDLMKAAYFHDIPHLFESTGEYTSFRLSEPSNVLWLMNTRAFTFIGIHGFSSIEWFLGQYRFFAAAQKPQKKKELIVIYNIENMGVDSR